MIETFKREKAKKENRKIKCSLSVVHVYKEEQKIKTNKQTDQLFIRCVSLFSSHIDNSEIGKWLKRKGEKM